MYNRTYKVTYEWDPAKADANYRKHRIHFADAVAVFGDESALTIEDEHQDERRSCHAWHRCFRAGLRGCLYLERRKHPADFGPESSRF
jgi:hypothetical protein